MEEVSGEGYTRGRSASDVPLEYGNLKFSLTNQIPASSIALCATDRPSGLGSHSAHAPSVWTDLASPPLCVVAGGLEPIEFPWYAIVPEGVRCQDCLEWMHA